MTLRRHFGSGAPRCLSHAHWRMSNGGSQRLVRRKPSCSPIGWCRLSQRPMVIEAQPVFDERGMCRLKPGRQYLRVDCSQVFARTGAQGAGKANQIVSRTRRVERPRRCRSVGGPCGRRSPDNLEFRLFRSAAGEPASDRADLTVFEWLAPILLGGLTLCQARPGRCCQGWCRCERECQRQDRQNCQEGSHCCPQSLRQSALSAPAASVRGAQKYSRGSPPELPFGKHIWLRKVPGSSGW
jgi:hypothetical protein